MMTGIDEQKRASALLEAQAKASTMFAEIETLGLIRPGVTESQLNKEIYRLSRDKYDAGATGISVSSGRASIPSTPIRRTRPT